MSIDNCTQQILFLIIGLLVLLLIVNWYSNSRAKAVRRAEYFPWNPIIPPRPTPPPPMPPPMPSPHHNRQKFGLYYFTNPNCPACQRFDPTWERIVAKYGDRYDIDLKKIDISHHQNNHLVELFDVKYTPTIILATKDGDKVVAHVEYASNRNYTYDDVTFFIENHMHPPAPASAPPPGFHFGATHHE